MKPDITPPTWTKQQAGRWTAEVDGHKLVATTHHGLSNHWHVYDGDEQIIATRTLRDARGWVESHFCYRRWDVIYGQYVNQTSAHWHIGLCTTRPGTYTHFEALAECKRRQATAVAS